MVNPTDPFDSVPTAAKRCMKCDFDRDALFHKEWSGPCSICEGEPLDSLVSKTAMRRAVVGWLREYSKIASIYEPMVDAAEELERGGDDRP